VALAFKFPSTRLQSSAVQGRIINNQQDQHIIMSSPSLYKCSAAGCDLSASLRCSRCLGAYYCSKECQLREWKQHKAPCKEAAATRESVHSTTIDQFDVEFNEFKRKAEAGDSEAQFNLGLCHFRGTGVSVDKREALKWYKKAAEAGHTSAQANLGVFYFDGGSGTISPDAREAIKWYTRAAEGGHTIAQYNLGGCYSMA
jgi:TPR repeat protein